MTIPNQTCAQLPPRCWDLNPELLQSLGTVEDFDIETHASAELNRDIELAKHFALTHGLDGAKRDAMNLSLKERHRAIWGKFSKA